VAGKRDQFKMGDVHWFVSRIYINWGSGCYKMGARSDFWVSLNSSSSNVRFAVHLDVFWSKSRSFCTLLYQLVGWSPIAAHRHGGFFQAFVPCVLFFSLVGSAGSELGILS